MEVHVLTITNRATAWISLTDFSLVQEAQAGLGCRTSVLLFREPALGLDVRAGNNIARRLTVLDAIE